MPISKINKLLKNAAFLLLITVFLNSCGNVGSIMNPKEPIEPDARKRARKNADEGRGIGGGIFGKGGANTNYQFASSNPLWRASLDTLDFMVIASVDYAGGLIISDWYSDGDSDESIKITLRFLDTEVRVDALKVLIHKKKCINNNCKINQIESDLAFDIKDKILKKAAFLVKNDKEKKKSNRVKSVISNEKN
jgi:hypothetical protein|tara:strand:- start:7852 stop:8430 length:579 start_codon:yes stop_codon:yes gene_type:complete